MSKPPQQLCHNIITSPRFGGSWGRFSLAPTKTRGNSLKHLANIIPTPQPHTTHHNKSIIDERTSDFRFSEDLTPFFSLFGKGFLRGTIILRSKTSRLPTRPCRGFYSPNLVVLHPFYFFPILLSRAPSILLATSPSSYSLSLSLSFNSSILFCVGMRVSFPPPLPYVLSLHRKLKGGFNPLIKNIPGKST